MISSYDVSNWFWHIKDHPDNKVFWSKTLHYIETSDPIFIGWNNNLNPTTIASEQELLEVLVSQWAPSYIATGMQIICTSTPQITGTYKMDESTQQQISGVAASIAAGRGLPGGQPTFFFQGHVFNEAHFLDFAVAAEHWVYGVYQSLGQMVLTETGSLPEQPIIIP